MNSIKRKTVKGVEYWYWNDEPGMICGTKRTMRVKASRSDTYYRAGKCANGRNKYELHYSGTPEEVK